MNTKCIPALTLPLLVAAFAACGGEGGRIESESGLSGAVRIDGDLVRRPDHRPRLSAEEQTLIEGILATARWIFILPVSRNGNGHPLPPPPPRSPGPPGSPPGGNGG